MSTLKLTFGVQPEDFSPFTLGTITVTYKETPTGPPIPLSLTARRGISIQGFFTFIEYDSGETGQDEDQAQAFRDAWNRDYAFVGGDPIGGGLISKNLAASLANNEVTITALKGTFDSYAYSGTAILVSGVIDNTTAGAATLVSSVTQAANGDCNTIDYLVSLTGGTAPFKVTVNGVDVHTAWDGTGSKTISLNRGIPSSVVVSDDAGQSVTRTPIVPRKLAAADFSITEVKYESSADVTVNRDIVVANVGTLQYSIDATTESTGQNYQTSNIFPSVASGTYKLFVKDAFDCEIVKTISVKSIDDITFTEQIKYFDIPLGQSIIFAEYPDFTPNVKKNIFNTLSLNGLDDVLYPTIHKIDPSDGIANSDIQIGTQFKSSYDYHIVTLYQCGTGTKKDIPAVRIQENLGVREKMDCVLFPIPNSPSLTGVYFQGGEWYEPDTTTIISRTVEVPDGTTPIWAKVGQVVTIDGLGGLTIQSLGYDDTRGEYFVVSAVTASEIAGKVQARYNRHDYDLFEFYIQSTDITDTAYLVVEKGFSGQAVEGNPWTSELIKKQDDTEKRILVEWSDTKNKGDIVYQSGIKYFARLDGEFLPDSEEKSETYSGDSQEYSLEQKSHLGFELFFEDISFKQVMQLNVASSLDGFRVNGLNLIRKDAPEKRRYGRSNRYSWRAKFAFGSNLIGIQEDETVLSVSTGVVGGGSTGKSGEFDLTGTVVYKNAKGQLVLDTSGNLIKQVL